MLGQIADVTDQGEFAPGSTATNSATDIEAGGVAPIPVSDAQAGEDGILGTADDPLTGDGRKTESSPSQADGGAGNEGGSSDETPDPSTGGEDALNQAALLSGIILASADAASTPNPDSDPSATGDDPAASAAGDTTSNTADSPAAASNAGASSGDPILSTFSDNAPKPGPDPSASNADPTIGSTFVGNGPNPDLDPSVPKTSPVLPDTSAATTSAIDSSGAVSNAGPASPPGGTDNHAADLSPLGILSVGPAIDNIGSGTGDTTDGTEKQPATGTAPSAAVEPTMSPPAAEPDAPKAENAAAASSNPEDAPHTSAGLHINLIPDANNVNAPAGWDAVIHEAAAIIEQNFSDPVTVNLRYGYASFRNVVDSSLIGSGSAYANTDNGTTGNYNTVTGWLLGDRTTTDDFNSYNALPDSSSSFPGGANNFYVANAQLRALGQLGNNSTIDGSAAFGTGISLTNLLPVALHELTHAMGRITQFYSPGTTPVIADWYRYDSAGHFQWSENSSSASPSYFSIDAGATDIADFGQTSDYSDFLNGGVQGGVDPFNEFYNSGTLDSLTTADIREMDALGFNRVDDYVENYTTTGTVGVNSSASGNLEVAGDRDWFAVTLFAGVQYLIDEQGSPTGSGTLSDTYLRLYDGSGTTQLASDDDSGVGFNSRLSYTPGSTGTYYVAAGSFGDSYSGTYTVSVHTDDYAADTGVVGSVAVNGSATGIINYAGDHDWFAVSLTAGVQYLIDEQGSPTGSGTLSDTYMQLYDGSGTLIATDDDSGVGFNSRLSYTPGTTGTYYVSAEAFGANTGTYTVSVHTDDFAADTGALTGTVAVNGTATGSINYAGDRDWFSVTLTAGVRYMFDEQGSPTGAGTLSDSLMRLYDGSGTTQLASDDDSGAGFNSRFVYTPVSTGTYYVSAEAFGSNTGTYTVGVHTDDFASDTGAFTGVVALGGVATGNLDFTGDHDWFAASLTAGVQYTFDLLGQSVGAGTLPDPFMQLFDGTGTFITSNDDGGGNLNSRIVYTPSTTGTYFVDAGAFANAYTGTYELIATFPGVTINGTAGNDLIDSTHTPGGQPFAGIGNDTINGNAGNDTLNGGPGADMMSGGLGNDTYIVDLLGDQAIENPGEGTDTVNASISFTLGANVEKLTLTGAASINGTGNSLANTITGNAAANILTGLDGNDTLNGGAGADTMYGGVGNDTYTVDNAGDQANENPAEGTDLVNASVSFTLGANVENLTLTGAASINGTGNSLNNVITGNAAANILTGLDGNDTLGGGAGADTMYGGLGNDTYIVDNVSDQANENPGEGTDLVNASVSFTLGANVENLTLTGAAAINGTGNTLNNAITGNAAANILTGLDGNDTLGGGAGADTMIGGLGNDTYTVDNAGDQANENPGEGTDLVNASISFTLGANVENLTLTGAASINGTGNALGNLITGNAAANILTGLDGNDTLGGGAGADTMNGGLGDDTYTVDNAGDQANENASAGTDLVNASVSFTLGANVENLTLTGAGANSGTGNALDNVITGNAAANNLSGLGGNDTLNGGAGADTMNGGLGNDTYTVDNAGDQAVENASAGTDLVNASVAFTLGANV